VLFLPLAACALSLLNTVVGLAFYRQQQLGARLLQGASVVVQLLFGVAVATIIR
jgi:lipopolysaccharide export LptBFGC system permease protein LptF